MLEKFIYNCAGNVRKAFTISELLIALGVIAVLSAVLMPIIHSLVPDQNTLMAKRAFYTTETVISALINDSGCYPPIRNRNGFEDGTAYRKCLIWGEGNDDDANAKFIALFTDKMDIRGAINNLEDGGVSFQTKDGMQWEIKSVDFSSGGDAVITIDVDGLNKGPSCGQVETSGACEDENRTKGFDKFSIQVQPSGKIILQDCWAIQAARTDKKLIGKFEENPNCAGDFNVVANNNNNNNDDDENNDDENNDDDNNNNDNNNNANNDEDDNNGNDGDNESCSHEPNPTKASPQCCIAWVNEGVLTDLTEAGQACCAVDNNRYSFCGGCPVDPDPTSLSPECCTKWLNNGGLISNANVKDQCCGNPSFYNSNSDFCNSEDCKDYQMSVSWTVTSDLKNVTITFNVTPDPNTTGFNVKAGISKVFPGLNTGEGFAPVGSGFNVTLSPNVPQTYSISGVDAINSWMSTHPNYTFSLDTSNLYYYVNSSKPLGHLPATKTHCK